MRALVFRPEEYTMPEDVMEVLSGEGITDVRFVTEPGLAPGSGACTSGDWSVAALREQARGYRRWPHNAVREFAAHDEPVLIAYADTIPFLYGGQLASMAEMVRSHGDASVFLQASDAKGEGLRLRWTGWAMVPASFLQSVRPGMKWQEICEALVEAAGPGRVHICMPDVLQIPSPTGASKRRTLTINTPFDLSTMAPAA